MAGAESQDLNTSAAAFVLKMLCGIVVFLAVLYPAASTVRSANLVQARADQYLALRSEGTPVSIVVSETSMSPSSPDDGVGVWGTTSNGNQCFADLGVGASPAIGARIEVVVDLTNPAMTCEGVAAPLLQTNFLGLILLKWVLFGAIVVLGLSALWVVERSISGLSLARKSLRSEYV